MSGHAGVHGVRPAGRDERGHGEVAVVVRRRREQLVVPRDEVTFLAVEDRVLEVLGVGPLSAARPAWKGLVMVPKFSRKPPAWLAARLSAARVVARSSPSSRAAPAAAPIAPHVAVLWNPC